MEISLRVGYININPENPLKSFVQLSSYFEYSMFVTNLAEFFRINKCGSQKSIVIISFLLFPTN